MDFVERAKIKMQQMMLQTRSLSAEVIVKLHARIGRLNAQLSEQDKEIEQLKRSGKESVHEQEVAESDRRDDEDNRQASLSDRELSSDLKRKYGTTTWARKMIRDIIRKRESDS